MRRMVVSVALLFVAGGLTGYCVFGQSTLSEKALRAYKAGEYEKALPLFKQMAARPEIRNDMKQLGAVMTYVVDIEQKLKAKAAGGAVANVSVSNKGEAAAGGGSGGEVDQSKLMAQAMAFALDQKTNPSDPAMGADRVPHQPVKPGEVLTMTIKEMGNFEYDANKGGALPADVLALDGARVRLNGYMIPLTQTEKLAEFALVPSLVGCCFGQPPGVQHIVTCHTAKGSAAEFSIDEIEVEGVLRVKVVREQDYTSSIFEVDVTGVRAKG